MRILTEIKIAMFLNKYSKYLRNKTSYYDNYYNEDWSINDKSILDLSDNDLSELKTTLDNEKDYLPR